MIHTEISTREKSASSAVVLNLVKLGLTRQQAAVYVAILAKHLTKPSQIAAVCGIERAAAYRILKSLSRLGMIEFLSLSPLECVAVPPDRALSLRKQELEELLEIEKNLHVPLREVMIEKDHSVLKSMVRLIPDRLVSQKKNEMIQSAKKEILISSPMSDLAGLLAESDMIWRHLLSDVQLKILTCISQVDDAITRIINEIGTSQTLSEVRHVEEVFAYVLMVDNAQVLIEPTRDYRTEQVGLWTDLPCYILPFRDYYKKMWNQSVNAQHRLSTLKWVNSIKKSSVLSIA